MAIAFFDLDLTLLSENSGRLWIRSELREGYVTRRKAAQAAIWLLRYRLGLGDLRPALREAIATLAETPERDLRARTWAFYEREVKHLVRPGAWAALDAHRDDGERLVLLTTSSNYLSEPVGEALGLDDLLCNRSEVLDGLFTGAPREPLCYGSGKVELAGDYAAARGVELADCAFYTDSISDLPMLEAVGRPVVVHPDPKLRRCASARGWPIVDWGTA